MSGFENIRHRETAEARLQRLNNGFRTVSRQLDRSSPKQWLSRITGRQLGVFGLMASLVAIGAVTFHSEFTTHNWSIATTVKHIAAAPNCTAARLVGLAPARRGQPGYYFRHDRDQDGIACEPWPRY